MAISVAILRAALVAALLAASGGKSVFAQQQMYRCPGAGGNGQILSDRPCVGVPSKLGAFGNADGRNNNNTGSGSSYGNGASHHRSTSSYTPPLDRAPDFLPHLSPACAQLNDAVRTGPARGLTPMTMRELRANYRHQCEEDEQDARQKAYEKSREARAQRKSQQQEAVAEQNRSAAVAAQCDEMLRILHGKRQRLATLTPGQKDDLQLFESNYKQRCVRG